MFDRERAHPLLHVRDRFQARRIGRVRGVDQREHVRVVVGRTVHRPRQIIPAITGQLLVSVRAQVIVERAPGNVVETELLGIPSAELEPGLEFVEEAIGVVREMFVDDLRARHL